MIGVPFGSVRAGAFAIGLLPFVWCLHLSALQSTPFPHFFWSTDERTVKSSQLTGKKESGGGIGGVGVVGLID